MAKQQRKLIYAEKDGRTKSFTQEAWALLPEDKNKWTRVDKPAPEPPEATVTTKKVSIETPPEAVKKTTSVEVAAPETVISKSPLPAKAKAKAKKK